MKFSGLSAVEFDFLFRILIKKIELIDLAAVQQSTWKKALELTKNVDEFDTPFIALSLELGSPLWTGDKKLIKGLSGKGIDWVLDTKTINRIRNKE